MTTTARTAVFAVAAAAAVALAGAPAGAAADPIDLTWDRLVPAGEDGGGAESLFGIVEHGQIAAPAGAAQGAYEVVDDFNGETVRLPGYLVPLDLNAEGGTEFLLVPYFGACIHVPPPPPNQIVYVTAEDPYVLEALFEPVWVTGEFDVVTLSTDLAEVAYSLSAGDIEAYIYE